jgi:hypothetical protein
MHRAVGKAMDDIDARLAAVPAEKRNTAAFSA